MTLGMYLFLSPAVIILSYIPFFGSFLAGLVGFIFFLFALVFAFVFSLFTISLAWLYYRPLIGILLFGISGGTAYLMIHYGST